MYFYVMDDYLRRVEIFDVYKSLVWTERYSTAGDFVLEIAADRRSRAELTNGRIVTVDKTYRLAMIETVEDLVDDGGFRTLKVSGRGLEAVFLDDRVATPGMTSLTATPTWTLTGKPADIARKLFNDICVTKINSLNDGIPMYSTGGLLGAGTIPEPATTVTMELEIGSLYEVITRVCTMYKLGVRFYYDNILSNGRLYFDIYTGDDLTTQQTIRNAVVFSPELDNMSKTSSLSSTAIFKNVALVMSANGAAYAYADGWDANTVVGRDRHVLFVKADDINLPAGAALTAALVQRGKEALLKNSVVIAFDGEISPSGTYQYGPKSHYDLGDLIELRNTDGISAIMRVEEFIRTSDASGESGYPTLVSDLLITPGSWLSFTGSPYWASATGYWSESA